MVRPRDLQRLTDELVRDPGTVWRLIGVNPAIPARPAVTLAVIEAALTILDAAYDAELLQAPSLTEVMFSLTGFAIAVAALGVAFAAPADSIVLVVAAGLAVAGALWSFADLGRKVLVDIDAT